MLAFLVAFATSASTSYLIVRSNHWHLRFTADEPGALPQKVHEQRVARIGGLGLMAGVVAGGLVLPLSPSDTPLFWLLVFSLLPAFFGGFAEDVTRKVGSGTRLLFTIITAAFAFTLVGIRFTRSAVDWLDAALAFLPFGYVALLFAVAGVAHAMNIIDGYHGLSSGVGSIILLAMAYVAVRAGDPLVAGVCVVTAAACCGFLMLNYPFGRLFLGDGGAYLLGAVIALAAAMLVQRNPSVSPWFPLALVVYPVWETLFSALRRVFIGTKIDEPDARHLHSLVYCHLSRNWSTPDDKVLRNALTSVPFWVAASGMAGLAVAWSDNSRALGLQSLIFMLGYLLVYWWLSRLSMPLQRDLARRVSGGVG